MMIVMTTMIMKQIMTTKIAKYKIKSRVACLVRRVCGCGNSVKLNQTQKRTNGQRQTYSRQESNWVHFGLKM